MTQVFKRIVLLVLLAGMTVLVTACGSSIFEPVLDQRDQAYYDWVCTQAGMGHIPETHTCRRGDEYIWITPPKR